MIIFYIITYTVGIIALSIVLHCVPAEFVLLFNKTETKSLLYVLGRRTWSYCLDIYEELLDCVIQDIVPLTGKNKSSVSDYRAFFVFKFAG